MPNRLWKALKGGTAPKGLGCLSTHRIVIHSSYTELLKSADLNSIRGVLRSKLGDFITELSKNEKNAVKRIEITLEGENRTFYLKIYRNHVFKEICARAFRGSMVGRSMVRAEYENLERLAKCGLRTPQWVAYGDHRFAGAVINAFIITEEIPNAMGVDYLIHTWLAQQSAEDRKHKTSELIEEMAKTVKLMHAHGFEHHDLFFRNMMVSDQNMSKLYVMDAPRGYFWPNFIIRKRRAIDLATLDSAATQAFTRSQRLRFMHLYLGCDRLDEQGKQLVRKVLSISDPMRTRQLKRLKRSITVNEDK